MPEAEKFSLDRADRILSHPEFRKTIAAVESAEKDRIFCRHGYSHLADTAREAWIVALESGNDIRKDVVYAAALLHDIGRAEEYAGGRSHDEAGPAIAEPILRDAGYTDQEIGIILAAIGSHRNENSTVSAGGPEEMLARILKQADHQVRLCFACPAYHQCKWDDERKNQTIR